MQLPEGLWPVMVDPSQMEQVLINLVINAVDAMRETGNLRIGVRNVDSSESVGLDHLDTDGRWVALSVRDDGSE